MPFDTYLPMVDGATEEPHLQRGYVQVGACEDEYFERSECDAALSVLRNRPLHDVTSLGDHSVYIGLLKGSRCVFGLDTQVIFPGDIVKLSLTSTQRASVSQIHYPTTRNGVDDDDVLDEAMRVEEGEQEGEQHEGGGEEEEEEEEDEGGEDEGDVEARRRVNEERIDSKARLHVPIMRFNEFPTLFDSDLFKHESCLIDVAVSFVINQPAMEVDILMSVPGENLKRFTLQCLRFKDIPKKMRTRSARVVVDKEYKLNSLCDELTGGELVQVCKVIDAENDDSLFFPNKSFAVDKVLYHAVHRNNMNTSVFVSKHGHLKGVFGQDDMPDWICTTRRKFVVVACKTYSHVHPTHVVEAHLRERKTLEMDEEMDAEFVEADAEFVEADAAFEEGDTRKTYSERWVPEEQGAKFDARLILDAGKVLVYVGTGDEIKEHELDRHELLMGRITKKGSGFKQMPRSPKKFITTSWEEENAMYGHHLRVESPVKILLKTNQTEEEVVFTVDRDDKKKATVLASEMYGGRVKGSYVIPKIFVSVLSDHTSEKQPYTCRGGVVLFDRFHCEHALLCALGKFRLVDVTSHCRLIIRCTAALNGDNDRWVRFNLADPSLLSTGLTAVCIEIVDSVTYEGTSMTRYLRVVLGKDESFASCNALMKSTVNTFTEEIVRIPLQFEIRNSVVTSRSKFPFVKRRCMYSRYVPCDVLGLPNQPEENVFPDRLTTFKDMGIRQGPFSASFALVSVLHFMYEDEGRMQNGELDAWSCLRQMSCAAVWNGWWAMATRFTQQEGMSTGIYEVFDCKPVESDFSEKVAKCRLGMKETVGISSQLLHNELELVSQMTVRHVLRLDGGKDILYALLGRASGMSSACIRQAKYYHRKVHKRYTVSEFIETFAHTKKTASLEEALEVLDLTPPHLCARRRWLRASGYHVVDKVMVRCVNTTSGWAWLAKEMYLEPIQNLEVDDSKESNNPPPSAPDDSAPDDSAPDDSASDDSAPDDSASDDSAFDDSAPDDSAFDDSASGGNGDFYRRADRLDDERKISLLQTDLYNLHIARNPKGMEDYGMYVTEDGARMRYLNQDFVGTKKSFSKLDEENGRVSFFHNCTDWFHGYTFHIKHMYEVVKTSDIFQQYMNGQACDSELETKFFMLEVTAHTNPNASERQKQLAKNWNLSKYHTRKRMYRSVPTVSLKNEKITHLHRLMFKMHDDTPDERLNVNALVTWRRDYTYGVERSPYTFKTSDYVWPSEPGILPVVQSEWVEHSDRHILSAPVRDLMREEQYATLNRSYALSHPDMSGKFAITNANGEIFWMEKKDSNNIEEDDDSWE
jgi:hypothetical protein